MEKVSYLSLLWLWIALPQFDYIAAASLKLLTTSNMRQSTLFPYGILQIQYNGEWGTVCDDSWDIRDTHVACKQLGYVRGLAHMYMGEGSGRIWLDDVGCTGSESLLENCPNPGWGIENCQHSEDIGIVCETAPSPTIRLSGGNNQREGRVEVYYNSIWGTVCDDYWTLDNANVICKMLGYPKARASRHFGLGSGQIWLDNVLCRGDESSIGKCRHNGWGIEDCSHGEDIGVVCLPSGSPGVRVRLKDGNIPNAGRVEVRYYGDWKTICDTNWDLKEANVICRMLGYSHGAAGSINGMQSIGDVWLSTVSCNGHESSIESCQNLNWGQGSCAYNKKAGVFCKSGASSNIAFRLSSGIFNYVGRLEQRYYGMWGAVCADSLDLQDANVVCQMMGYSQAVTSYKQPQNYSMFRFSLVTNCSGTETSIQQCGRHQTQVKACESHNDIWVVCKPLSAQNSNLTVRLVDGDFHNQGRVEVQYQGIWGTICGFRSWGLADAHVICRMLNYGKATWAGTANIKGSGPVWIGSLSCRGNEKSLQQCQVNYGSVEQYCNHDADAGVTCEHVTKEELSVTVRLVGAEKINAGAVEVNYKGAWIPVCDDTWDTLDAHVICRMLGYKAALAGIKRFSVGRQGRWIGGVECNGDEISISECYHRGWTNYGCPGDYYAGVTCKTHQADPPLFKINGTNAIKESTVLIVFEEKRQIESHLKGFYQVVVEKRDNEDRFKSYGQPTLFVYNEVNVTIAAQRGNDSYITAEILVPISSLTIGDGQYYNSYYNAPLQPGSMYRVHVRIVTIATDGRRTFSRSAFVVFMTKQHIARQADPPLFKINGTNAITESTVLIVFEEKRQIESHLKGFYQVVVEKRDNEDRFKSYGQPTPIVYNEVNVTIAAQRGNDSYITAEILVPISSLTIGDGQYYHSYYNAPLQPGSMYRVHVRIITIATDGRRIFSRSAFVVFMTKQRITQQEKAVKSSSNPVLKGTVIGLSVFIAVLLVLIIGSFVWCTFIRKKEKERKNETRATELSEIPTVNRNPAVVKPPESHYQSLNFQSRMQTNVGYDNQAYSLSIEKNKKRRKKTEKQGVKSNSKNTMDQNELHYQAMTLPSEGQHNGGRQEAAYQVSNIRLQDSNVYKIDENLYENVTC